MGNGERWAGAIHARREKKHWRSLAQYLGLSSQQAEADLPAGADEFPPGADEPLEGMSRRSFMTLLGASMALAGVSACTSGGRPSQALPYTMQPPDVTPGLPSHYASSMPHGGYATGVVVESNEGRPTNVQGNPDHPASLGKSGIYEQASVLQLYDPNRATSIRQGNLPRSWKAFTAAFGPSSIVYDRDIPDDGDGVHFLLEATASPLETDLIGRVRKTFPKAVFHFWSPVNEIALHQGTKGVFGRALTPLMDLTQADVVVSFDHDFLANGFPDHLRYAHDFAQRRRMAKASDQPNRLYIVEPSYTPTGTMAEHRLRRPGRDVLPLAGAVAAEVLLGNAAVPADLAALLQAWKQQASADAKWVKAVADDLKKHAGKSVLTAGPRQPAAVHALCQLMNQALGATGKTVRYVQPGLVDAGMESHGLEPLVKALKAKQIDTLVMLGGNPVYDAPADLDFAGALKNATQRIYLGLYENETAAVLDGKKDWFVPAKHYLEAWGDGRAYDGTITLQQPLIRPLYEGRSVAEVLSSFAGDGLLGDREILRKYWRSQRGAMGFDAFFDGALRTGVVKNTAFPAETVSVDWPSAAKLVATAKGKPATGLELSLQPDPKLYDGRFANLSWLLELPDPVTKLSWDNAALMSPATARKLGVDTQDLVELEMGGRKVQAPVLVFPGQADETVSLSLGWGRQGAEAVCRGIGAKASDLATGATPWFQSGLKVKKLGKTYILALTQTHWTMHDRPVALSATVDEYRKNPEFTAEERKEIPTIRHHWKYQGVQWGMTIDLSLCTGCNACVVACQSENNIPVVGKVNVRKSREMHWLRIDRYFFGDPEDAEMIMQPMMCQQCEDAPCEYVCPVNATVHSPDGINEMVYNRCVGTRFCQNNCPYKVRRFNWFNFHQDDTRLTEMVYNPDVTVRARGVMEKCNYCVQRIREAQIHARVKNETFTGDNVVSACMQSCPTGAIVFGPISDPKHPVSTMRREKRAYKVLNDVGTHPRTQYLARIRNPNPALVES